MQHKMYFFAHHFWIRTVNLNSCNIKWCYLQCNIDYARKLTVPSCSFRFTIKLSSCLPLIRVFSKKKQHRKIGAGRWTWINVYTLWETQQKLIYQYNLRLACSTHLNRMFTAYEALQVCMYEYKQLKEFRF